MSCAWSGSFAELRNLAGSGQIGITVADGFRAVFGEPSPSEKTSWQPSLSAVIGALEDRRFDSLQAIVEMQMPVGGERADLILLGGRPEEPRAFVIELKQWSSVILDPGTLEVSVPGIGPQQHPSTQVLNYLGKLRLFHSRAADYNIRAGAYLPNLIDRGIDQLRGVETTSLVRDAPLYGGYDSSLLERDIGQFLLPCMLDSTEHDVFTAAPFDQTRHLFDVLREHADSIAKRAITALAATGIGLTEEQELVVEAVLSAVRKGAPKVFIVDGLPGSGKTLVAVTLLLRALESGHKATLAIRNNRLQAILRECFRQSYQGADGTMLYFEVPRSQSGIGDRGFRGRFELVICDEAQRMRKQSMPVILGRAPVSVFLLDESQRLNPPEEGTVQEFLDVSAGAGQSPELWKLSAAVRSRGGRPYHQWLETLIENPGEASLWERDDQIWRRNYVFEVAESAEAFVNRLAYLRDLGDGSRVAMVASFTESPGSIQSTTHPDNMRVGFPLTSGWDYYRDSNLRIRWLMQKPEYIKFWMGGQSNLLERVASIYGAQGFESDYVGLFWGRDFVIRNGNWTLGNPEACYDSIDGLVSRGRNKQWAAGALDLVRNRYRIFLTRGIKGTLVFCEDLETREFLLSRVGKRSDDYFLQ